MNGNTAETAWSEIGAMLISCERNLLEMCAVAPKRTGAGFARRVRRYRQESWMETMIYNAVFDRAEDGSIWGYTPDVPGAYGAGATLDEAKASLREGIRLWMEVAREQGEPAAAADDPIEIVESAAV